MSTSLFQVLAYSLRAGTPVVSAVIVNQTGSAPRTAGARMLIFPDGSTAGTIGGGRCEAEVIRAALGLIASVSGPLAVGKFSSLTGIDSSDDSPQPPPFGFTDCSRLGGLLDFSLQGSTDMDMICGGNIRVLLECVHSNPAEHAFAEEVLRRESLGETFSLVTEAESVMPSGTGMAGAGRSIRARTMMVYPDETGVRVVSAGAPAQPLEPGVIPEAAMAAVRGQQTVGLEGRRKSWFICPFPATSRLVIFGAGHVSRELAELGVKVGFRTIVVDDRSEYACAARFPQSEIRVLAGLDAAYTEDFLDSMALQPKDGIAILTRGHAHDREVLRASLRTGAGYIGMIGSRSKRQALYAALREQGVVDEDLAKVRTPIGLPIGAQTPEEIAVSIVAELILWRSQLMTVA